MLAGSQRRVSNSRTSTVYKSEHELGFKVAMSGLYPVIVVSGDITCGNSSSGRTFARTTVIFINF